MDKKIIRRMRNQIEYFKGKLNNFDKALLEELSYKTGKGIRCKNCGLKDVRMRQKDKTYFCRSCGYDSRRRK